MKFFGMVSSTDVWVKSWLKCSIAMAWCHTSSFEIEIHAFHFDEKLLNLFQYRLHHPINMPASEVMMHSCKFTTQQISFWLIWYFECSVFCLFASCCCNIVSTPIIWRAKKLRSYETLERWSKTCPQNGGTWPYFNPCS